MVKESGTLPPTVGMEQGQGTDNGIETEWAGNTGSGLAMVVLYR